MTEFVSGACRVRPGETQEVSHVKKLERAHLHARMQGYRSELTEADKRAFGQRYAEKDLSNRPTFTGIGGQKSFPF